MHGDVPKMAGKMQGKDVMHGEPQQCLCEAQGLHTMSQQGLVSVTGHNSIPPLQLFA